MMTTPWQPAILSEVPFVKLEKVIGRQIEFQRGFASGDALKEEDCTVYSDGGRTTIATKVCIASSQVSHNAVLAGKSTEGRILKDADAWLPGFFVCPNTPTDLQHDLGGSQCNGDDDGLQSLLHRNSRPKQLQSCVSFGPDQTTARPHTGSGRLQAGNRLAARLRCCRNTCRKLHRRALLDQPDAASKQVLGSRARSRFPEHPRVSHLAIQLEQFREPESYGNDHKPRTPRGVLH